MELPKGWIYLEIGPPKMWIYQKGRFPGYNLKLTLFFLMSDSTFLQSKTFIIWHIVTPIMQTKIILFHLKTDFDHSTVFNNMTNSFEINSKSFIL